MIGSVTAFVNTYVWMENRSSTLVYWLPEIIVKS
jgi:hypothetical protein